MAGNRALESLSPLFQSGAIPSQLIPEIVQLSKIVGEIGGNRTHRQQRHKLRPYHWTTNSMACPHRIELWYSVLETKP